MNNTLKFDGKSTYVEVPLASPTNDGNSITVEFWNFVKKDEDHGGAAFMFSDTAGTEKKLSDNKPFSRIHCHAPHFSTFIWDCGGEDWEKNGRLQMDYSPYMDKWTHIALVHGVIKEKIADKEENRQFQAIYINGELKMVNDKFSVVSDQMTRLIIGKNLSGNYHKGQIDEFRVWNRIRTADEIKRDMNAQLIGDESGLVACFNFNWGFQDYVGKNWWGETLETLPNSVEGGADGKLYNFTPSGWVASELVLKAPVGPVYRLKSTDETKHFYTSKLTEKTEFLKNIDWQDDGIAFYAHRAAAPGTQPLYRFHHKTTGEYLLTIDRAKRQELDPRIVITDPTVDWIDDDEIVFVSATLNGDAVPLYVASQNYRYTQNSSDLAGKDPDPSIACYVLPNIDGTYKPKPIIFNDNGLSEHLWYALICRTYNEKWGLQVIKSGGTDKPVMGQIPATGSIEQFQWRLLGNRLINRNTGLALTISKGSVKADYYNQSRPLAFTPVPNKGTDCFTLVQNGAALSYKNDVLSGTDAGNTGETEQWTLLAMEPVYGYSIPGPPESHAALPFSKYFEAKGVHILGTGTVSDWAMLRVKLIIENMLNAVKDSASIAKMKGIEMFMVSRDDSAAELNKVPCIGMMLDEGDIAKYRGKGFPTGQDSFCYATEEMMWKEGVFNRPDDKKYPTNDPNKLKYAFRKFDQVVHEFLHIMDHVMGFDGNNFPHYDSDGSTEPSEVIAGKTQSWFNSIGDTNQGGHYNTATRKDLETKCPTQYAHLAKYFDPANTWMPPEEFRDNPSIPQPIAYIVAIGKADFTFQKDEEYYGILGGSYFLRFQSDGNFVVYDGTPTSTWAADVKKTWGKADKAVFKADGDLAIYDKSGVVLWNTNTGGNPGATLHLNDEGKLYIADKDQKTIWSNLQT